MIKFFDGINNDLFFIIFTQLHLSLLRDKDDHLVGLTLSCRKPVPLILDQEYVNLKNQIIKAERRVLKELGFCVHVKHPHKVCTLQIHSITNISCSVKL